MSTFLFNDIIFGPIKSRRLGTSLGVNLLPLDKKYCNFDCVYCECGWNSANAHIKTVLPKLHEVVSRLTEVLLKMKLDNNLPDVITFAGNGEPTMHPDFPEIIDAVINIRDQIAPNVKIAVLSNATLIQKPAIKLALSKVDQNILKLDSGIIETIRIINQPPPTFDFDKLIENLMGFRNLSIQTLFLKGTVNGKNFDNTTSLEIDAWLAIIEKIKPIQVMIYTIARDTPSETLEKIEKSVLDKISSKVKALNIAVKVSN